MIQSTKINQWKLKSSRTGVNKQLTQTVLLTGLYNSLYGTNFASKALCVGGLTLRELLRKIVQTTDQVGRQGFVLKYKKNTYIFCKFSKRVQANRVYMAFKGPPLLETEHAFVLTPQWFWLMINQRLYKIVRYYHGWYKNDGCISPVHVSLHLIYKPIYWAGYEDKSKDFLPKDGNYLARWS